MKLKKKKRIKIEEDPEEKKTDEKVESEPQANPDEIQDQILMVLLHQFLILMEVQFLMNQILMEVQL